ncbi:MAG: hypothetical protein ABIZ57_09145 [Candidatus Limnocylindria bacterium]
MSQTAVVSRLALRELWITFRLLFLLAAYVGAGTTVALLPAPLATTLFRLAAGVAVAAVAGAAVAAWSLSRGRSLGRAAWLATHAIPRVTILIGWFVPVAAASLVGLLGAGILGWLAMSASFEGPDPFAFTAVIGAVGAQLLVLLALGLLLGSFLAPWPAVFATVLSCGLLVVAPWAAAPRVALPFEALARLLELVHPIAVAVQGAGASLAASALLLLAARVALERVDL